jgi:hypothetical protein
MSIPENWTTDFQFCQESSQESKNPEKGIESCVKVFHLRHRVQYINASVIFNVNL